ncbi:hypothetical protein BJY52DRAFT_1224601 [Lactarius psammicola]|nr:hypothetical protein BJY52DRAFT_1224601 [Lactarius psammicola]
MKADTGAVVLVGIGTEEVELWDVGTGQKLRSMSGHQAQIAALSWHGHIPGRGEHEMSSGDRATKSVNRSVNWDTSGRESRGVKTVDWSVTRVQARATVRFTDSRPRDGVRFGVHAASTEA